MTDLNSLVSIPGLILTNAMAINNHGQIVVYGMLVPEPETYACCWGGWD